MEPFDLRSIITEEFQNEIQNSFAYATGFGVVFTDTRGIQIGPGGNFCRFCKKVNACKEGAELCSRSNRNAIQLALKQKKPSIYICHAGLVNIEIPLIYQGKCVGAITAGQVLCEEEHAYPTDEIASKINWLADPELAAFYKEVEVMSRQKIEASTTALSNLTNYVIQKLAYSKMQEELAQKTETLLIAENQIKQPQLNALQQQVMPHFIFNVITSISRLLSTKDYQTAQEMLDSFAQMLRYSLSNLKCSVRLEDELKYIENYLAIQKIRFGKRITYQIDCDPGLRSLRIPFLSLQPLVENAVEHGLLKDERGGTLTISCVRHMNYDSITVSDNGRGIPPSKLKLLRAVLYDDSDSEKHIGLRNSYKRLYLMFNRRMSFSINSTEHLGTEIIIAIVHE